MLDKTILVTGFGPFGEEQVNASWQAVQLLDELDFDGCKLIKLEVPVTYDYIDKNIPRLWEEHKPDFVLHVGVSSQALDLTIESLARRKFYRKADADGQFHPTGQVCPKSDGPDVQFPQIDVERIVAGLNGDQIKFIESTDAGLYLCEYTFYSSLNVDNSRTMFTHVPRLNNPYSVEELAHGLTMIIRAALQQLDENKNSLK